MHVARHECSESATLSVPRCRPAPAGTNVGASSDVSAAKARRGTASDVAFGEGRPTGARARTPTRARTPARAPTNDDGRRPEGQRPS